MISKKIFVALFICLANVAKVWVKLKKEGCMGGKKCYRERKIRMEGVTRFEMIQFKIRQKTKISK